MNKKRTIVCGDIHGAHKALVQCLERSNFNKDEDTLIQLGDVCDGWSEVYECVEELLSIKNLICIKGNHDEWFHAFLRSPNGMHPDQWIQGGEGTLKSYTKKLGFGYGGTKYHGFHTGMHCSDIPESHLNFFLNQKLYYKDKDNNLFIHGGFNRHYTLEEQFHHIFYWDRDLFYAAMAAKSTKQSLKFKEEFNKIYIGHTEVTHWGESTPIFADKVVNMDTGAGFKGKLTFMDIATNEIWQSDLSKELYPDEKGRN